MRTHAEFRSRRFPPYDGEEDEINPGLWGRRLAEYLVAQLPAHGVSPGVPVAEDWGYFVPVSVDGESLAVCCGHQHGDDDEFLCFTEPAKPVVRGLFRKRDVTAPLTKLVQALDAILSADPDIHALTWRVP